MCIRDRSVSARAASTRPAPHPGQPRWLVEPVHARASKRRVTPRPVRRSARCGPSHGCPARQPPH
eukprot:12386785-Alexandrium_andersonii.AAC.1